MTLQNAEIFTVFFRGTFLLRNSKLPFKSQAHLPIGILEKRIDFPDRLME